MTDEALAALAEALRPFSTQAEWFSQPHAQAPAGYIDADEADISVTVGDLRRARTAYESIPAIIARVAKAEERVKELEGALRPFASAVEDLPDGARASDSLWETSAAMGLSAGDLHLARAVLEKG